jgi:hypothetical protein
MQRLPLLPCFMLALLLTGCYLDPYQNPNDWSMSGATRKNLAVQVADPADLITGKSNAYSNGVAASAGIDKALGGAAGTGAGLEAPPANSTTLNITGS